MRVLGIESSSLVASVAIVTDGILPAEYTVNLKKTHSQTLLPMIDEVIRMLEIELDTIDAIAVSGGPGSFTGLRIGLATAEALAYAWKKPLQGVATPLALAYNLPVSGIVLSPVLDAQKGNYYQALYEWQDGEVAELQSVQVVNKQQLLENLALQGKPAVILGECARLENMELPGWCSLAPEYLRLPQAAGTALAALKAYNPEVQSGIFGLEPYYIRKSEAEELWEQKHGKQ